MKKIIFLYSLILTISFSGKISYSQGPNWLWAKNAVGTLWDQANSIKVDHSGNIYVAGYFQSDTIYFGNYYLVNSDSIWSSSDLFLAKYDANGNVLWAKSAKGTNWDIAKSITLDDSGNIYLAGDFRSDSIIFDSISLMGLNGSDYNIFLTKYNSNGNAIWAKAAIGAGTDEVFSVANDASGNIYLAGTFDFPTLTFDTILLTNNGVYDGFLAKYDSQGNLIWAKSAGGIDYDQIISITIDSPGNTYIAGDFISPTITFGSISLTNASNAGFPDIFIAKYDANGNIIWANRVGDIQSEYATSVMNDIFGNIYLTGDFHSSTLTIDSFTLTNSGFGDIFLAKYDASGNIKWAKSVSGEEQDNANSLAVDAIGNFYLTGNFSSSTITFNSATDSAVLSNTGTYDIFLTKFDSSGNVVWAKSADGLYDDNATSVALDTNEAIYIAGWFASPSFIIGSTTLVNTDYNGLRAEVFLAKCANDNNIDELRSTFEISVYPNPASESIVIVTSEKATIEILNMEGQLIKTTDTKEAKTQIDIKNLANAVYIIKALTEKGIAVMKFVKQ